MTVATTEVFFSSAITKTNTQFWNAHAYSSDNRPPPIVYPTPAPAPTTTSSATPSYLAMYLPTRLSSACSCLHQPVPTVTRAGTQTVTVGRTTSVDITPRVYLHSLLVPLHTFLLTIGLQSVHHQHRHVPSNNLGHLRRSLRPFRHH